MYYCNKCQYIGETGHAHNLPEKLDGADDAGHVTPNAEVTGRQ